MHLTAVGWWFVRRGNDEKSFLPGMKNRLIYGEDLTSHDRHVITCSGLDDGRREMFVCIKNKIVLPDDVAFWR